MNINCHSQVNCRRHHHRRGATAVEFALCVPLLFLVTWGCIEMTRYNLVKNVANQSAFEAARIGVKPGATAQEVVDEAVKQMRYVCETCEVQVTPTVITSNTNFVTVDIQVDIRAQGLLIAQYFSDPILEATFTIRRDNVATF